MAPATIPHDERLVTDRDFLLALDPRRKDLRPIRAAAGGTDLTDARAALVNYFRHRPAPRWFFDLRDGRRGTLSPDDDAAAAQSAPPEQLKRIREKADEVCRHIIRVTGNLPYDLGPGLDWRTAELRGTTALPSRFKGHAFIRDLASAYALTGDARYARTFDELVGRWLRDWPLVVDEDMRLEGVVFSRADGHKTMPTAVRWQAWMDALYSGIVFDPAVAPGTAFGLLKSLWFTALQYRRFASTPHAPANHHLWSRGIMPVVFGALLPEFPELRAMIGQGRPVIDWHARHGFLPDGGYEERSLNYSLYVLRMYLLAMAMERLNGVKAMNNGTRKAVRRCADAVASLTLPSGMFPDFGDGEAGKPASMAGELAELATHAGSRVARAVIRRLDLARHLSAGKRAAFDNAKTTDLPLTVHLPDSGYLVARDGWRPGSSAMAMSLPAEGLSGHAHDDALSVQLVVRGESLVGTPYSELKAIVHQDRYFNKQACGHLYAMTSHNVVLVNGQPLRHPRELVSRFGVSPTPVRASVETDADGVTVSALHSGYPGVRLGRRIRFVHGQGWTVLDEVTGRAEGPHVARWHFEYGVEARRDGKGFLAQRGQARLLIRYSSPGGCRARLYRDRRWLGRNPLRPGAPAPWVLDIRFAGGSLETSFTIDSPRPQE